MPHYWCRFRYESSDSEDYDSENEQETEEEREGHTEAQVVPESKGRRRVQGSVHVLVTST